MPVGKDNAGTITYLCEKKKRKKDEIRRSGEN